MRPIRPIKPIRPIRLIGLISLMWLIGLVSCTESFEERCRREAREYTEQQCPRLVDRYICLDSMTYEDAPQGFTYHHTVMGELDNDSLLTPEILSAFHETLLENIRNDINLKRCKDRGFTFTYRYTSASTGKLFTEASIGPEDYNN
jgi:ADP-ribose pyrophosphatase YjhB (NUDIX family)